MIYPGFPAPQAHRAHQAESLRPTQHAIDGALQLGGRYQLARGRGQASASSAHGAGSAVIRMFGRINPVRPRHPHDRLVGSDPGHPRGNGRAEGGVAR